MIETQKRLVTQHAAKDNIIFSTRDHARLMPELHEILSIPGKNWCGYAALSAVNLILRKDIVGAYPEHGTVSIGELVDLTLREHKKPYVLGNIKLDEWKAITETGSIYHQALISVAKGLGVQAHALEQFDRIETFQLFLENKGVLLLSVDNRFIAEQTVRRQNIDTNALRPGTHILALLGYDPEDRTYSVFDPYGRAEVMNLSAEAINTYLPSHPKAIALTEPKSKIITLTQITPRTQGIYQNEYLIRSIEALVEQRRRF